jgi:type IV secretion system protein VirB9
MPLPSSDRGQYNTTQEVTAMPYSFHRSKVVGVLFCLALTNVVEAEPPKPTEVPDSAKFAAVEPGRSLAGGTAYKLQPGQDAIDVAVATYRKTGFIRPIKRDDGTIEFPFGAYPPKIAVAPFRQTDIQLQAGEQIASTSKGSTQFQADVIATDPPHVIIKPLFLGPDTNLTIVTTRRTYHIDLVTLQSGNFIPSVRFFYPEEMTTAYLAKDELAKAYKKDHASPDRCMPENRTNTKYWWKGDGIHPVHVADDLAGHTYILMPGDLREAPAVVVVRDGTDEIINSRFLSGCIKVDAVAEDLALIVGDKRVEIHSGDRGWWQ